MLSVGFKPANISDEFLSAIGSVTVEFAMLEYQIESAIWSLLGLTTPENQAVGKTITTDLTFHPRLNLLGALLQLQFPRYDEHELGLKRLIADIRKRAKMRNLIVHSIWDISEEEGKVRRIKTTAHGKPPRTKSVKLSANDISLIAAGIRAATRGLINLHVALAPNPILESPRGDSDARPKKTRDRRKP
jgi:hypothetical protein